jgi:tRNA(fMet)-specific endonuclease VapC
VKYLFDTDTLSTLLKPDPPKFLVERISSIPIGSQFISTISILEITYGAYKSGNPERYITFLEKNILPQVRVLFFDDTCARIAGRIRAEREKVGEPVSPLDLQIAATAVANGCFLITGNTRHFQHISGLEIENWLKG